MIVRFFSQFHRSGNKKKARKLSFFPFSFFHRLLESDTTHNPLCNEDYTYQKISLWLRLSFHSHDHDLHLWFITRKLLGFPQSSTKTLLTSVSRVNWKVWSSPIVEHAKIGSIFLINFIWKVRTLSIIWEPSKNSIFLINTFN